MYSKWLLLKKEIKQKQNKPKHKKKQKTKTKNSRYCEIAETRLRHKSNYVIWRHILEVDKMNTWRFDGVVQRLKKKASGTILCYLFHDYTGVFFIYRWPKHNNTFMCLHVTFFENKMENRVFCELKIVYDDLFTIL